MFRQRPFDTRFIVRGLFSCMLLMSVANVALRDAHAGSPVADEADDIQPVAVGDVAPRFVVRTVDGGDFVFDPGALERPSIIVTFRGGWCPYCNMHLSELRHVLPEINDLGIDVLFLSGDRPDRLYQSLRGDTQKDIDGLDYRILSDADANAAIALGIAFRASDTTISRRHEKGDDIAGSSMMKHRVLPVPAVFAIGADGIVSFVFAAPDYKIRLPAEDLLGVAKTLAVR